MKSKASVFHNELTKMFLDPDIKRYDGVFPIGFLPQAIEKKYPKLTKAIEELDKSGIPETFFNEGFTPFNKDTYEKFEELIKTTQYMENRLISCKQENSKDQKQILQKLLNVYKKAYTAQKNLRETIIKKKISKLKKMKKRYVLMEKILSYFSIIGVFEKLKLFLKRRSDAVSLSIETLDVSLRSAKKTKNNTDAATIARWTANAALDAEEEARETTEDEITSDYNLETVNQYKSVITKAKKDNGKGKEKIEDIEPENEEGDRFYL